MRLRTLSLAAAAAATLAIALPRDGSSKGPDTYPLSKVKPGQKGIGRTVFEGTKPEEFTFEVIGVVKNFLPKQDVILFKSDDPKMVEVGITAGMSGSPLYIDGKVACALAYGWRFSKKAIGGCTPIEYMIKDATLPRRGVEKTSLASADEWKRYQPMDRFAAARDALAGEAPTAWLDRAPLPPLAPQPTGGDEIGLVRAAVPLSMSGFSPGAYERAKELFSPYGVEPMQAGGTGDPNEGPSKFEMGGAIGVQLVSGDLSATGTGTVSYLDGNTVIAFGHPMFGMGEAYLPITSARIHTIIPSLMSSFKLSSPMRVLGSLTQDRQSSIAGDTSLTAEMIPVEVKIKSPAGGDERFSASVIRHRFLTPQLVMLVVASAAQALAPDIADATLFMKSKLSVRGYEPLVFTDYIYSVEGASVNAIGGARALRALVPLLFNPYAPVKIDRFEIEVDVRFQADYTELLALRVPETELPWSEKTYVEAVLRPYGGKEYVERIPLEIPRKLAGSMVKIEVVAGDAARPDVAPPTSLEDVMAALRKTYPANTLVATIYTPEEGVTLGGKVLPELPDSAIDTARQATSTRRGTEYKSIVRTVVPSRRVVIGKQELVIKIQDDR